jgi:mRNA interferase HigB
MRVHLIKKHTIEDYASINPRSRIALKSWLAVLKYADWNKPMDIQNTFGSADLLGKSSKRVVFNIGGNNYRMICKYVFGYKEVHLFVCWIGTHVLYNELCNDNRQYTVNDF